MTLTSEIQLPSLAGKTALVTGVSRRRGIGYGIARELASRGASVFIHHFSAHDSDQPWGADDLDEVRAGVRAALVGDAVSADASADLRDAEQITSLMTEASALTGTLDILVCNHARSGGDGSILDMTAGRLDAFWDANTRSTILLTQDFARRFTVRASGAETSGPSSSGTSLSGTSLPAVAAPAVAMPAAEMPAVAMRPGDRASGRRSQDERTAGRVFWMTSGQQDGPMRGEVAYATSKAALAGVTATVAAELLDLGIILNTINPGPVNTGYLDAETTDRDLGDLQALMADTPFGRFGTPDDPARLIGWLASAEGSWIVGQVLKSDGGIGLA